MATNFSSTERTTLESSPEIEIYLFHGNLYKVEERNR